MQLKLFKLTHRLNDNSITLLDVVFVVVVFIVYVCFALTFSRCLRNWPKHCFHIILNKRIQLNSICSDTKTFRKIWTTGCSIYFQFISIINLYMFQAALLLIIIRMHYSVYTAIDICHGFILTGCYSAAM